MKKSSSAQNPIPYVESIKGRLLLGAGKYSPYPYEKEKLLCSAIKSGNRADAGKYLNELLGYIFFAAADDMETIKVRSFELVVLMSRAAIEGGVEEELVYRKTPAFASEFFSLNDIDSICRALSGVLSSLMSDIFGAEDALHSAVIAKAVAFIGNNYMHKITLADTAGAVYISPSYLSKIFRDEMHSTFGEYLSRVRIEKSKILLSSGKLGINEIASLVGFSDQSYFNKVFKKYVRTTPKKFRESCGD